LNTDRPSRNLSSIRFLLGCVPFNEWELPATGKFLAGWFYPCGTGLIRCDAVCTGRWECGRSGWFNLLSESQKGKIWRVLFKGNKDNIRNSTIGRNGKKEDAVQTSGTPMNDRTTWIREKSCPWGTGLQGLLQRIAITGWQSAGIGSRFPPLCASGWVTGDKKKPDCVLWKGVEGPQK